MKAAASYIKNIMECAELTEDIEKHQRKISFLCNQMLCQDSRKYTFDNIKDALSIFLKSRSAYRQAREILYLPAEATLKTYFGRLGTPDSIEDCRNTVGKVFEKLANLQKLCFISVDEMHVKPAIRYRGNKLIGYAVNTEEPCPAKSVLAMLISPSLGAPAFVARLLPVTSLKADFLYEQVNVLIEIIHQVGGYCFLVMSDNYSVNQSMFSMFHRKLSRLEYFQLGIQLRTISSRNCICYMTQFIF